MELRTQKHCLKITEKNITENIKKIRFFFKKKEIRLKTRINNQENGDLSNEK